MKQNRSTTCILFSLLTFILLVSLWLNKGDDATIAAKPNSVTVALEPKVVVPAILPAEPKPVFDNKFYATKALPYRLSNTDIPFGKLLRSETAILLRNALIETTSNHDLGIPEHLARGEKSGIWMVQANGPITRQFHSALRAAGARVNEKNYLPHDTLIVRATPEVANSLRFDPAVGAVAAYEPYFRLEDELLADAVEDLAIPFDALLKLTVFKGDEKSARQKIVELGAEIVKEDRSPFGDQLIVLPKVGNWLELARLDEVQLVEKYRQPVVMNDLSRVRVGISTNTTTTETHLGLTGANIMVAVIDTGLDTNHVAFGGRAYISDGTPTNTAFHGTHVAGIIGSDGSGTINAADVLGSEPTAGFQGMAPGANLVGWRFGTNNYEVQEQAVLTNITVFGKANSVIVNNSYGTTSHTYDSDAASWDAAVRDGSPGLTGEQPLMAVFAAGNDGGGNRQGQGGFVDSVTSPATFKNGITVGALEQLREVDTEFSFPASSNGVCVTDTFGYEDLTDTDNEVASFSSRGNVDPDVEGQYGRFKPDLVAPGIFSVSTRANYTNYDGQYLYPATSNYTYYFEGITLRPGETNSDVYTIDYNATNVTMWLFDQTLGELAVFYTNQLAMPSMDPTYYVGDDGFNDPTNTFSYAVDDSSVGLWYVDMVNTNTENISFDLRVTVTYTNCNTPEFNVGLSNINQTISGHAGTDLESNGYQYQVAGTSFAAPVVSGMLALMQELFEENGGIGTGPRILSPALMKALLLNGARSPNESYSLDFENDFNRIGWGLPNIQRTLPEVIATATESDWPMQFFDQSATEAIKTGTSHKRTVSVSGQSQNAPLRVTLVWTDPPGNPSASMKLVNDLDLVVSNSSGVFYHGNAFKGSSFSVQAGTMEDFVDPDTMMMESIDVGGTNDIVNNVESVFIEGPIDEPFDVYVIGKRVNVNAVTDSTNGILQDYALVIASGDLAATGELNVGAVEITEDSRPIVTYFDPAADMTFALLNQRVGANNPYLVTTNGTTNQWQFYVVENSAGGSNAAFVTFLPPNLGLNRGIARSQVSTERSQDADIDIYVSTDSDLTNLVDSVVAMADRSLGRGGSEFVVYTNSAVGDVYYVGIKAEDQQSAEFGFFSVFTDESIFEPPNDNGEVLVRFIGPVVIPDGVAARPGVTSMFGINIYPISMQRAIVTNHTVTHELYGDLVGTLQKEERTAVLNNHRSISNQLDWTDMFYDDSRQTNIFGLKESDGPATLNNFIGYEGSGLWMFNMADNAYLHTGSVETLELLLIPQGVTNSGNGIRNFDRIPIDLGAYASYQNFIQVPAGVVEMKLNVRFIAGNGNGTGPIETRVRRDFLVTGDLFDYEAIGSSPGYSLNVSVGDDPPLSPGKYYFRIRNLTADDTNLEVLIEFEYDFGINPNQHFVSSAVLGTEDNAFTNGASSAITVSAGSQSVTDLRVGLRMQNERASDYAVYLASPSGTRVLLTENRGYLSTNGYGLGTNLDEYVYARFSENAAYASDVIKFEDASSFVPFITPRIIATNFLVDEDWEISTDASSEGSEDEFRILIPTGRANGILRYTYNSFLVPDRFQVYYEGNLLPGDILPSGDTGWISNLPKHWSANAADIDDAADEFTITGHNFVDGDTVWLANDRYAVTDYGANLPGGLVNTSRYVILNVAGDIFQLALASAPTIPIDITSTGTGTTWLYGGTSTPAVTIDFPYNNIDEVVEIVVNAGGNSIGGTQWTNHVELLDDMGNPAPFGPNFSSQKGTDIVFADGRIYVGGVTEAFATNGIIAGFNLPMIDEAPPIYSLDWPNKQGGTEFNTVAASGDKVYGVGHSYTYSTDTYPGKTTKGVMARFPFENPIVVDKNASAADLSDGLHIDFGIPGSDLDMELPSGSTYTGIEIIHGSLVVDEGGVDMLIYTGTAEDNAANAGRMFVGKLNTTTDTVIWSEDDVGLMVMDATSIGRDVVLYDTSLYIAGSSGDSSSGAANHAVVYEYDLAGLAGSSYTAALADTEFYGGDNYGDALYFVGSSGTGSSMDAMITKLDDSLNEVWAAPITYDGAGGDEDVLYSVAGYGDRLYAVGSTMNASGDKDGLLLVISQEDGSILDTVIYEGFDVTLAGDQVFRSVGTDEFDLYVVGEMRTSEALADASRTDTDLAIFRYQIVDEILPEEDLSAFIGEAASGSWRLEIVDTRTGDGLNMVPNELLSWDMQMGISLDSAVALPLIHATTITNQMNDDSVRYYSINVPFASTQAQVDINSLSGDPFLVWFNRTGLPTTGVGTDHQIEAIPVTTSSITYDEAFDPKLVPGQKFYLAISNSPSAGVENSLELTVTFDATATTFALQGSAVDGALVANESNANVYQFSVLRNDTALNFVVTNLTGDVDVVISKGEIPSVADHDYRLQLTDVGDGSVRIDTSGPEDPIDGTWFARIVPVGSDDVSYQIVLEADNNEAPWLGTVGNQTVVEGDLMFVGVKAIDAQSLTYSLTVAPNGAEVDSSGVVRWIPGESAGGVDHSFTVVVSDDGEPSLSSTVSFHVMVSEGNTSPVLPVLPIQVVDEGSLLSFSVAASDSDIPANGFSYSIVAGQRSGMGVSTSGLVTWTPAIGTGNALVQFVIEVTDDGDPSMATTRTYKIQVKGDNRAPIFSPIADYEIIEERKLRISSYVVDPDYPTNDVSFAFDMVDIPSGMTIDSETGWLTWPTEEIHGPSTNFVTIKVVDDGNPPESTSQTFKVVVLEENLAPIFHEPTAVNIEEESLLIFVPNVTDPDLPENELAFAFDSPVPTGMTIDPDDGKIRWNPEEGDGPAVYEVDVVAIDNGDPILSETNTFRITVLERNEAPVLAGISDITIGEGGTVEVSASATDSDVPANQFHYYIVSAPFGASISPSTGEFRWATSEAHGPGVYEIILAVHDGAEPLKMDTVSFTVTVGEVNQAPVIVGAGDLMAREGETLNAQLSFADADLPINTLVFSLDPGAPSGLLVHPTLGRLGWTPGEVDGPQTFPVTVRISDNGNPSLSSTASFNITVEDKNTAPTLAVIVSRTVNEKVPVEIAIVGADSDLPENDLVYSLEDGANLGARVHPETGLFEWTPGEDDGPGSFFFRVKVTDNGNPSLSAEQSFGIIVNEVNAAPTLPDLGVIEVEEGESLAIQIRGEDVDVPSQLLRYQIIGERPTDLTINSISGLMFWRTSELQGPSTHTVTVEVYDSAEPRLSSTRDYTIKVKESNQPPTIDVIGSQHIVEGHELTFSLRGADVDLPANTLEYSSVGSPLGFIVDGASGEVSWTPTEEQGPGTYDITVKVSDGGDPNLSAETIVHVTVGEDNTSPTIDEFRPLILTEGVPFVLNPVVTDADLPAQDLSYVLIGQHPEGLVFDSNSGGIVWTPSESHGGTHHDLELVVTDSGSPRKSASRSFVLDVSDDNQAPVMQSIVDQSIFECDLLSIMVFASDSDHPSQTLTYSLGEGAPAGVVIDSETGELTVEGAIGGFTNTVEVIVTDSGSPQLSASRTFELAVAELGTNLVSLTSGVSASGFASVCSDGKLFFSFDVPADTSKVLFELHGMAKNVDLVLRRGEQPANGMFDIESRRDGAASEMIVVHTNETLVDISGLWYLSVPSAEILKTAFEIRATVPEQVEGGTILLSAEPLKLAPVIASTDSESFEMDFGTIVGEKYSVEVSTDLLSWMVLTNIVVTGADSKFVDPSRYQDNAQRFYRIRQVPQ
ncbi:putative Ig domain-containing protein [Verrucomicrobia bacterium]|nr:putative Ig domain-containing protein [Verrucomicrobiota bacterium]